MKKVALALLIVGSCISCKSDDDTQTPESKYPNCMQSDIDDYIQSNDVPADTPAQITKYTYKNQDVYGFDPGSNYNDWLYTHINDNCETICEFGSLAGINTCEDWDTEAVFKEIVWKDER